MSIPDTMRAVVLSAYDGRPESLKVEERPVPRPGPGEVLVRLAAAPINPSDLMFLRGTYGVKKPLPAVPGFEGSGMVVAAGGVAGKLLVGRRVACGASMQGDGTWAEYIRVPLGQCLPLRAHLSDEQGATLFVNPFTAWALMDLARQGKHRAVAQTAAASALGRMLLKLAARERIPLVNVVRRKENAELLRGLGAEHVVDSSEPGFEERLRELFHRLGVTLAFDAVAGPMTGHLLAAMPPGGCVTVYGALSEEESRIPPGAFIFERKRVEGFWLSDFFLSGFGPKQLRALMNVPALVGREMETPVRARLELTKAREAVKLAAEEMTSGKVLLVPG
ncbi:zinc-binding dehydrogenase [Archangium lansingense]|uniref:zinc-binding dehydrogenase n=1 Tax=Archangium lansingense TaxID=2995310 RepID=UPI003B803942